MERADVDVDTLLKVVLVLVVVWLGLQIVQETVGLLLAPFGPLRNVIGLLVVLLIVLYLLDVI